MAILAHDVIRVWRLLRVQQGGGLLSYIVRLTEWCYIPEYDRMLEEFAVLPVELVGFSLYTPTLPLRPTLFSM